jgi:hypothetical protein
VFYFLQYILKTLCTTCLSVLLRYTVERGTLRHVVHKVLRYIVELETLRHVVHTVLRYIVERVLVSPVPQYI